MTTGRLHVADLTAGYRDRPVIAGLTLPDLAPGELMSLIGPNAAGKSTLLRALAGLLPASGSVRLGDEELLHLSLAARARHVTYMPQSLPQRVALSVLEAVIGALRVSAPADVPLSADAAARRAIDVLEQVGIAYLAMEPLDRLSGGQRQLASLAQALVRAPRLLLLDEPISALDLHYQLRVMQLVRRLAHEQGMIVVVVLHDLALAARWSDKVVVLSGGAVAAAGTPAQAITPAVLANIYRVDATVEAGPEGDVRIFVNDIVA